MLNIGIIAPSHYVDKEKVLKIENFFKEKNINVIFAKNVFKKFQIYSGTVQERIDGIHEIYENQNVDIVLALKGGSGCSQVVDNINYDIIKYNKKLFFGFSDITALHCSIIKNTNQQTFYSLNASNLVDDNIKTSAKSKEYFINFIKDKINKNDLSNILSKDLEILRSGCATGVIVGGNTKTLEETIGTSNELDFANKILFLEETEMNILEFINMLYHLKRAKKFEKLSGLIIGDISKIELNNDITLTIKEIINTFFSGYNIPIIINKNIGHGQDKIILPFNKMANINTCSEKIINFI